MQRNDTKKQKRSDSLLSLLFSLFLSRLREREEGEGGNLFSGESMENHRPREQTLHARLPDEINARGKDLRSARSTSRFISKRPTRSNVEICRIRSTPKNDPPRKREGTEPADTEPRSGDVRTIIM